MGNIVKIILCTLLLMSITSSRSYIFAQSIPEPGSPVCAYCGASLPNGVHSSSCPYYAGPSKSGGSRPARHKSSSPSSELNAMIAGVLFQSLVTSLFTTNTPNDQKSLDAQQRAAAFAAQQKAAAFAVQQAAEWQRAKDAAFQAEHDRMMKSFKQLDGTQGMAFKGLSGSELGFKALDDDMETLAANARKPFDSPADMTPPVPETSGGATPFFGDTMPLEDIQLLVNPENDPRVVDLRNATAYVVENIKNDSLNLAASTQTTDGEGSGKPVILAPDCAKLTRKLNGFINQRNKFHKTINLAQEQLGGWESANRNALLNAAKDGLEYFFTKLLTRLAKRGEAADRLQHIYEKNNGGMAQEGLDIADIETKIKRLRIRSSIGRISELTNNLNDWQTFIKDGMSGLMMELNSSNHDIQEMLEDPKMQKYFETESPKLKTLLDISEIAADYGVFGKWVAKQVPIIAAIELSVDQSYNALDWWLSFKRMTEANKINGKVLATARSIQNNIDVTHSALRECH